LVAGHLISPVYFARGKSLKL